MNLHQFGSIYGNSHMTQPLYQSQPTLHNDGPRARHSSLQINTSPQYHFFPNSATDFHMPPQSANPQLGRPSPVRFGSDSNFSTQGYRDPDGYNAQAQVKGGNLNNVPFAAHVASANEQSPQTNFTSNMAQPRRYQNYGPSVADYKKFSPAHMSAHSPTYLGGLPRTVADPMSGINRHGHPFMMAARPTTEHPIEHVIEDNGEDDEEEEELVETYRKKRRKSQITRDEEDDEYTPSAASKPASKRNSRVVLGEGSDDDYMITPTTSKASIKRRKSSATARRSYGSDDEDESPMGISPSSAGPRSNSKKKTSRPSQSRANLTEEEKRRNHIASEKTRRDLIKNQYDELDAMVPALKTGKSGLSRSDVLKEIVDYVGTVIAGNREMQRVLRGPVAAAPRRSADDDDEPE